MIDIPNIDFSTHPAYGLEFGKPNFGKKVRAIARLLPSIITFSMIEVRAAFRAKTSSKQISECSAVGHGLAQNGIVVLNITANQFAQVSSMLNEIESEIAVRYKSIQASDRSYDDCQRRISEVRDQQLFKLITIILREAGVMDAVKAYIEGASGELKSATFQWNNEGETHWHDKMAMETGHESAAPYLHVDTGSKVCKAILYLNKVGVKNGPFSYIVGSNRRSTNVIDRVIRSSVDYSRIGRRDSSSRELFSALPKFLQRKADFGFDLLDVDTTISESEKIVGGPAGTLVLFDNFGMHRGGMVKCGHRKIIQCIIW